MSLLDKKAFRAEKDQIVVEWDQLDERLLALEERLAQMGDLKSRLEQTEQEKMAHIQEATQLHVEFSELKVKWAQLQDTLTLVAERESTSMEQINNLEANLHSKI